MNTGADIAAYRGRYLFSPFLSYLTASSHCLFCNLMMESETDDSFTVVYTTDKTDNGFHNLCTQLEESSCLCI